MNPARQMWLLVTVAVIACLIAAAATGALRYGGTALTATNPLVQAIELIAVSAVQLLGTFTVAGLLIPTLLIWRQPMPVKVVAWRVGVAWSWVALAVIAYAATVLLVMTGGLASVAGNWEILWAIPSANALLISAACAAGVALVGRNADSAVLTSLAVIAVVGVAIPAVAGHGSQSSSLGFGLAVLHSVAACLWIAGVFALAIAGSASQVRLRDSARRFGWLAVACVAALAISGLSNSIERMQSPSQLATTPFGWLVLIKAGLLIALVVIAIPLRTKVIDRLVGARPRTGFLALTGLELTLMALAVGLGVALAQSPIPN